MVVGAMVQYRAAQARGQEQQSRYWRSSRRASGTLSVGLATYRSSADAATSISAIGSSRSIGILGPITRSQHLLAERRELARRAAQDQTSLVGPTQHLVDLRARQVHQATIPRFGRRAARPGMSSGCGEGGTIAAASGKFESECFDREPAGRRAFAALPGLVVVAAFLLGQDPALNPADEHTFEPAHEGVLVLGAGPRAGVGLDRR